MVRGRILSSEVRKTKQEEKKLLILSLTDDTDSIAAKLFLKAEIADKLSAQLQEGTCVKIKGVAGFDPYSQERSITTVFGISTIEEFAVKRNDSAKRKRVELHCHTKSSDMDGVSDVRDIVKTAYDWGMPAVAITDHGVVHSFPDANHKIVTVYGNGECKDRLYITVIKNPDGTYGYRKIKYDPACNRLIELLIQGQNKSSYKSN